MTAVEKFAPICQGNNCFKVKYYEVWCQIDETYEIYEIYERFEVSYISILWFSLNFHIRGLFLIIPIFLDTKQNLLTKLCPSLYLPVHPI